MIGHKEGDNYRVVSDRGRWGGSGYEKNRGWGPFVEGVPLGDFSMRRVNTAGWAGGDLGVFIDAWDQAFDYFKAHRHYGGTTGDIYPRASNSPVPAAAYPSSYPEGNKNPSVYLWVGTNGDSVGGIGLKIPVMRWISGAEDYGNGNAWAQRSVPTNANSFIVASPGGDRQWGTDDDVANWGDRP
jgi:hypothetical protein